MNNSEVIKILEKEVKAKLSGESSGHDWWHVYRVWQMAKKLAKGEKANTFICEIAALLHDISDWKFNNGDESVGPKLAKKILQKYKVSNATIEEICEIISTMSYKGAKVKTPMRTLEGRIVQDADRLDAIGAIGIGRTFAYGGFAGLPMHEPGRKIMLHKTKEEYFKNPGSTINHFYEKLLLLKDRMNTKTAKRYAQNRHKFMEQFLQKFYNEWKQIE